MISYFYVPSTKKYHVINFETKTVMKKFNDQDEAKKYAEYVSEILHQKKERAREWTIIDKTINNPDYDINKDVFFDAAVDEFVESDTFKILYEKYG